MLPATVVAMSQPNHRDRPSAPAVRKGIRYSSYKSMIWLDGKSGFGVVSPVYPLIMPNRLLASGKFDSRPAPKVVHLMPQQLSAVVK